MNILAIDTAGKTAAVAVMRDDTLLYEMASNTGLTHSETLLPMVDTALKACGLTPAQLDLYAVTNGPGSFTGLRIGLAAVKGLAFAANTPCAGVSTMAALAYGVCGEGTVIGAQDARRGQVYWAGFDLATHARLTPDAAEPVTALEAFVKECKKPLIFVGDGAALCYNTYKDQPGILPCPQPLRVLRGAVDKLSIFHSERESGSDIPVYGVVKNKRTWKYIDSSFIEKEHENLSRWKILISSASGKGELGESIGPTVILKPFEAYTQTFLGVGALILRRKQRELKNI